MSFTTRTLTHVFSNPDGTPASGSITFQLSKRITNGTTTIAPGEVTATLDSSGNLSQSLTANNDTGTLPQDSFWNVVFRLQGQGETQDGPYPIIVPAGSGSVDLGSLLPGAEQTQ